MIQKAEEILQVLQQDAEFMALVGTYEFSGGQTYPALVILSATQQVENLQDVHGMEVIVSRVPRTETSPTYGSHTSAKTWTISLIVYEDAAPGAGVEAADRLCALFLGANYSSVGGSQSEIAGVDQLRVQLPPYVSI